MLGKIGDWTLPLGPYTPTQLGVAFVGAFVLIKTFSWWSTLGPLPVAAWGVAVWAARNPKIGGRSPMYAAAGLLELAVQPRCGRIGGRAARERRPRLLYGEFVVDETDPGSLPTFVETSGGVRATHGFQGRPKKRTQSRAGRSRRRHRPPHRSMKAAGPAPTTLQRMLQASSGGDH
ncbi:hypothetical protein [Streptomyces megasporus]|uniref:hypothetical protein n=1 Tax=Streptomyces megasporus TaxID=44060 RepID=UPI00068C0EB8|nr:hypothetical protein [Streptomyces megasporus]